MATHGTCIGVRGVPSPTEGHLASYWDTFLRSPNEVSQGMVVAGIQESGRYLLSVQERRLYGSFETVSSDPKGSKAYVSICISWL